MDLFGTNNCASSSRRKEDEILTKLVLNSLVFNKASIRSCPILFNKTGQDRMLALLAKSNSF